MITTMKDTRFVLSDGSEREQESSEGCDGRRVMGREIRRVPARGTEKPKLKFIPGGKS